MARQRTMTKRRTGRIGRTASTRPSTRRRSSRGRFASAPTRRRRGSRANANLRRRSRAANLRRGRRRSLPLRGANGRFVKRRVRRAQSRPARRLRRRPARRRVARRRSPGGSIVREASERSKAGPALVRRRWYRVDGPVDPSLPEGYAYPR